VPALPPYLIEPIWQQFSALLPERRTDHPLGCHRSRIPERIVFEKLVEVLVFGCAYERIADTSAQRDCMKTLGGAAGEVLRTAQRRLFGSFCLPLPAIYP
jgi:hypothetical protein